ARPEGGGAGDAARRAPGRRGQHPAGRRAGAGARDPRLPLALPRALLHELREGRPGGARGRRWPARHRLAARVPHEAGDRGEDSSLARLTQVRATNAIAPSTGTMNPSITSTPTLAAWTCSESAAPKQDGHARKAITGSSRSSACAGTRSRTRSAPRRRRIPTLPGPG